MQSVTDVTGASPVAATFSSCANRAALVFHGPPAAIAITTADGLMTARFGVEGLSTPTVVAFCGDVAAVSPLLLFGCAAGEVALASWGAEHVVAQAKGRSSAAAVVAVVPTCANGAVIIWEDRTLAIAIIGEHGGESAPSLTLHTLTARLDASYTGAAVFADEGVAFVASASGTLLSLSPLGIAAPTVVAQRLDATIDAEVTAFAGCDRGLWVARGAMLEFYAVNSGKAQPTAAARAHVGEWTAARITRIVAARGQKALVLFQGPTASEGTYLVEAATAWTTGARAREAGSTEVCVGAAVPVQAGSSLLSAAQGGASLRRRWVVAMADRTAGAFVSLLVPAAIARDAATLSQKTILCDVADLGQQRVRCEAIVADLEARVQELTTSAGVRESRALQREITEAQSVALALAEREERIAHGAISPENSVSRMLMRRLQAAHVRRAAAHLLGVAGTIGRPLHEFVEEARARRHEHLDTFKARFNAEFRMDADSNANTITNMLRWAPRGTCIEVLLSRSGLQHDASIPDVVANLGHMLSEAQALLVLFVALAGQNAVGDVDFAEFFHLSAVAPSCLQWARAAIAADVVDHRYCDATLDTACAEGMRLAPAIVESFCDGGMLDVAHRMAPLALETVAPHSPLSDKLATRLAFVAFHCGNGELLVRLARLSIGTTWRTLMLKIMAHASVSLHSVSIFDVVGGVGQADEDAALREFALIEDPAAKRLRVQYLVLVCRFRQALEECGRLPARTAEEAQENQVLASYLRTLAHEDAAYDVVPLSNGELQRRRGTAPAPLGSAPEAASAIVTREPGAVERCVVVASTSAGGNRAEQQQQQQSTPFTHPDADSLPRATGRSTGFGTPALFTQSALAAGTPAPIVNPQRAASRAATLAAATPAPRDRHKHSELCPE